MLVAAIDPLRGGKITSLVDSDGVEWLAAGGSGPFEPGTPFVDAEMGGWDECAPTIDACRVGSRDIPDHGDLWDRPFTMDGDTVTAVGASLGYRFTRAITSTGEALRFEYTVDALDEPIPFLWAAHPQFSAPPGTRVELDPEVTRVIDVLDPALPEREWDARLASIDSIALGEYRKLYVAPSQRVSSAVLRRPDGRGLRLRWPAALPCLGIWFDNSAYSRAPVISLEPTTSYFDSLERAVRLGTAVSLTPGIPFTWWLEVSAIPPRSARANAAAP